MRVAPQADGQAEQLTVLAALAKETAVVTVLAAMLWDRTVEGTPWRRVPRRVAGLAGAGVAPRRPLLRRRRRRRTRRAAVLHLGTVRLLGHAGSDVANCATSAVTCSHAAARR